MDYLQERDNMSVPNTGDTDPTMRSSSAPVPQEVIDLTQDDDSSAAGSSDAINSCSRCQIKKRKCDGQRPCNLCQLLGTKAAARCTDYVGISSKFKGVQSAAEEQARHPSGDGKQLPHKRAASSDHLPESSRLPKAPKTSSLRPSHPPPSNATPTSSSTAAMTQAVTYAGAPPHHRMPDTPSDKTARVPAAQIPISTSLEAFDQDVVRAGENHQHHDLGAPVLASSSYRPDIAATKTTARQDQPALPALSPGAMKALQLPAMALSSHGSNHELLPPLETIWPSQGQAQSRYYTQRNLPPIAPPASGATDSLRPTFPPPIGQPYSSVHHSLPPRPDSPSHHDPQVSTQYSNFAQPYTQNNHAPALPTSTPTRPNFTQTQPTFTPTPPAFDHLLGPIRHHLEEQHNQIVRREMMIAEMDRENFDQRQEMSTTIDELQNKLAAKDQELSVLRKQHQKAVNELEVLQSQRTETAGNYGGQGNWLQELWKKFDEVEKQCEKLEKTCVASKDA